MTSDCIFQGPRDTFLALSNRLKQVEEQLKRESEENGQVAAVDILLRLRQLRDRLNALQSAVSTLASQKAV